MHARTAADPESPPGRPPRTNPPIPDQRRRADSAGHDDNSALPGDTTTVAGLLYPPCGRRRQWAIVVPHCACGYMHRHASDSYGTTFARSPSCRPSSTYLIHTVVVLPEPTS